MLRLSRKIRRRWDKCQAGGRRQSSREDEGLYGLHGWTTPYRDGILTTDDTRTKIELLL